jgi:hypothetical protein
MASFFKKFFSRTQHPEPLATDVSPGGVYSGLREQALSLGSETLDLPEGVERPFVWGALMETDYTGVTATLFTLADGTTSLYLSNGGGMIGGQGHEAVRAASATYLELANAHSKFLSPCDSFPLPLDEGTLFYFLTDLGVMRLDRNADGINKDEDVALTLFSAGQDIITELRLISESERPAESE